MDATSRALELGRLHRRIPVRRYGSLVGHWVTRWFRAPRKIVREPVPPLEPGQISITFGGHATVIVRYAGLAVALDPMFGRWIGGVHRAVEPGLAPPDVTDVGLILLSHRRADHLHLPTLRHLPRTATVVTPAGAAAALSSLGYARVVELAPGADLELRGIQVTAAATAHGDSGLSFVLQGDGPTVYACGDGGYFSGFGDLGERFAPDIAMLPIGGFLPASFRARHMSPLDALYAFEDLRARIMIPIHHGAFALSYERLEEPARWLLELARHRGMLDHVVVMAPGQTERFMRQDDVDQTGRWDRPDPA